MDVNLLLVRNVAALIFIASCILYDLECRLKELKIAKNVATKRRELIYYLLITLPFIYLSSLFVNVQKYYSVFKLWLQRNTDFVKFLDGQNLVYVKDFKSRHELPTLILMKFDGTSREFYETMRLHVYNVLYHKLDQNQSICSEVTSFKNFHYIRRDKEIHLNKYVQEFSVKSRDETTGTLTKRQLLGYIAIKHNAPLNINKHPLWNILIGREMVKWDDNDEALYYPVLFKFSHCLFDRESFIKLILGTFADVKNLNLVIPDVKEDTDAQINFFSTPFIAIYNFICYVFIEIVYRPYASIPALLVNCHLLKKKKNALSIRQRNQALYLYTLDMGPHFLQQVGEIKTRFPNATEFSILEAVVAASLTQYCRRYQSKKCPVDFVCMSVENDERLNPIKKRPEFFKFEEAAYESNVGFTLLNICTPKDQDIKVQDILEQNYKQKNASIGIKEVEITKSLFNGNYFYYSNFFKNSMSSDKCISALIANCPGPSSAIKMNGISVEHIISWSPHLLNTGMAFRVCSYRGTYQLTMNINRSLLNNIDQADGILDNITEFLNKLCAV